MLGLKGYEWLLWSGAKMTLIVGVCAMVIATVLGLVGAWGKLNRSQFIKGATDTYTTIFRGVPELVMILMVYYGVPTLIMDILDSLGADVAINLNPFVAGVLTIGCIYGAFATEVFKGAYLAVPIGQIEAARAMGMSRLLTFRRILLPQMLRFALPGLGNVWMVLIKATALISVIQLPELMRNAYVAAQSTRKPFTFYFAASLIYLALTIASMAVQHAAEVWANRGVRRA